MKIFLYFLLALGMVLTVACSGIPLIISPTDIPTQTSTSVPPTVTITPTFTLTPTLAPPTVTPTPAWVFQPAGKVTCPILLYHQIADINPPSQYYMPPAEFKAQMEALHAWGYTPIPISLLAKAITSGADLPPRPVVISFDDGDQNVYTDAFPVMRDLGFPGVIYIISSALNGKDRLTSTEILEMVAAGWEVGVHSMTHINLTDNHGQVWTEASRSRSDLEDSLGIPINTFAYPYGAADTFVMRKVSRYGYTAAVGLGSSAVQGPDNLFYLSRIEVVYGTTLDQFAALLPWSDPVT